MTTSGERERGSAPGLDHATVPLLDGDAFRLAFERHAATIHRYACARVGARTAEEVLATTFEVAWRLRERYTDHSTDGLEAWLIGVATIIVRRHRRAERRWLQMCADTQAQHGHRTPVDELAGADDRLDAAARARRLAAALAHIPRRERDVLLMHVLQELSYEQIARALDIPIGTVRSRISRARARLAERMGGGDDA